MKKIKQTRDKIGEQLRPDDGPPSEKQFEIEIMDLIDAHAEHFSSSDVTGVEQISEGFEVHLATSEFGFLIGYYRGLGSDADKVVSDFESIVESSEFIDSVIITKLDIDRVTTSLFFQLKT